MNNLEHIDKQGTEHQSHGDINLHIERLVLDGFAYSLYERGELQEALQRELTDLVVRDGLGNSISGGMTPTLRADPIQISASTRPAQVGNMVAGSVFNSLNQKL